MQNDFKIAKSADINRNKDSLIILCHGFMSDNTKPPIKELTEDFEKSYPVLSVNFNNESSIPTFSYCLDVLDDAIKAAIEQGYSKIHLIGHSMGASIITIYAAIHKGEIDIRSLSCISMSYKANIFNKQDQYKPLTDNENIQISINGNTFDVPVNFIRDAEKYRVEEYLNQITQPTLFVQGRDDRLVQNNEINEMYSWMSNKSSKVTIIENTGHLFKGHIGELQKVINEFIEINDKINI